MMLEIRSFKEFLLGAAAKYRGSPRNGTFRLDAAIDWFTGDIVMVACVELAQNLVSNIFE
jgi:hypothetical protein